MKQISKKDLIKIITESAHNTELDEMASEVKGLNPWDEGYTGKEKKAQVKARFFIRQHGLDYKNLGAVDVFIYNIRPLGEKIMTTKGEEEGRGVDEDGNPKNYKFIVLCHDSLPTISEDPQEQSNFEKRFNGWVESMKSEGYALITDSAVKVKDDPIGIGKSDFLKTTNDDGKEVVKDVREDNKKYYNYRKRFGVILSEKTGVSNSVSENININFLKTIRKVMDNEKVVEHLSRNGVPEIFTPKNLVFPDKTVRNHGSDVYGERSNKKIEWSSNRVFTFGSLEEFASWIDENIANAGNVSKQSNYLKRVYVKGPKKGSFQHDSTVTVRNDFSVLGQMIENGGFVWKLKFTASVGSSDSKIGMEPFASVEAEERAPSSQPGKDNTIMSNIDVYTALINGLEKIRHGLLQINIQQLYDKSFIAVNGLLDLFSPEDSQGEPQPELEPQFEPQGDMPIEKAKKVKKITKEAIESMINGILKESIIKK